MICDGVHTLTRINEREWPTKTDVLCGYSHKIVVLSTLTLSTVTLASPSLQTVVSGDLGKAAVLAPDVAAPCQFPSCGSFPFPEAPLDPQVGRSRSAPGRPCRAVSRRLRRRFLANALKYGFRKPKSFLYSQHCCPNVNQLSDAKRARNIN